MRYIFQRCSFLHPLNLYPKAKKVFHRKRLQRTVAVTTPGFFIFKQTITHILGAAIK
jgi:hypothetical protein